MFENVQFFRIRILRLKKSAIMTQQFFSLKNVGVKKRRILC
jgi:hypothetical protein